MTKTSMPARLNRGFSTLRYSKESEVFLAEELPLNVYAFFGASSSTSSPLTINDAHHRGDLLSQVANTYRLVLTTKSTHRFTWTKLNSQSNESLSGTAFSLTDTSIGLVFEQQLNAVQVQQQTALLEWEKTVNSIDDIVHILDPEMRIIRANNATYQKFGIEEGQLIGRRCHMALYGKETPCDNCPAVDTLKDCRSHKGNRHNENTGHTFSTSSSPIFDDNNQLSMVVLVARDITENVIQEEERRELSAAIEQITEAVLITDHMGTIQYINPAFSAASGYGRNDIIGSDIRKMDGNDQESTFYKRLWEQILTGQAWSGSLTHTRKDGSFYSALSTISPILDDKLNISAFVVVMRDTSKEDSLEKQLQQATKLEAIGTLAGGIAHDFNNILSAMIGYAQIAKGYVGTDPRAFHAINHIISSGDRAADLIKQILTFSRQEQTSGPFKPLRIQYIIKSVLQMLRSSFPATIKINQHIDNGCPPVLADASQIHQVVMNLCTNARHAIGEKHGEITITLAEKILEPSDPILSQGLLLPGHHVHLEISDSGCGMDEHTLKRIFDPFFSTKPKDRGTGLGLSVVHGVMRKHNSSIEVESVVDQGTTFSLLFPTTQRDSAEAPEREKPFAGGTEHILLIDDEPQITELLSLALTRLGYTVTSFCDSMEAVHFFRENSSDFDLVITDMTMPNMTGVELSREILSLRPELPIVLVTGYSASVNKVKALRIGIRELLTKPFRKDELAQIIRKILDNG